MLGYTHFGAGIYASGAYSIHLASDRSQYHGKRGDAEGGEASLLQGLRHRRNRWGDFTATVVDPIDDTSMWTIRGVRRSKQYVGYVVGLDNAWRASRDVDSRRHRDTRRYRDADAPADRDANPRCHFDPDAAATPTPSALIIGAHGALPHGHKTATYSASLEVKGGSQPYIMAVVMGHLPPGLSIDQTAGAITGVALKAGIWEPNSRDRRRRQTGTQEILADREASHRRIP